MTRATVGLEDRRDVLVERHEPGLRSRRGDQTAKADEKERLAHDSRCYHPLHPIMSTLPLEGITVVALEQAVAAPFATRQLADFGARVIKIERPGVGDFARAYDTKVRGASSHFAWNR
jgi:hypothetical protein